MTATSRAITKIAQETKLTEDAVDKALDQLGINTLEPEFPVSVRDAVRWIKEAAWDKKLAREELADALEQMEHVANIEAELAEAIPIRDRAVWLALHSGVQLREMDEEGNMSYGWLKALKARPAPGDA